MRILITNDDGVYAPGLAALHGALAPDHDIRVVAPETEQSAVGHAITLADPIRVRPLGSRTGFRGWAVSSTPADCVKLAIHELLTERPHLVLSGINLGANLGVNLLYSGTVSAATEAALLGFQGMAFALDSFAKDADFSYAALFAAHLAAHLDQLPLESKAPLNINIPAIPPEEIKGVRFTRQSQARLKESFWKRSDPRDRTYYWQAAETMDKSGGLDTDYPAHLSGYVTITPLTHDLTHYPALGTLAQARLGLPTV